MRIHQHIIRNSALLTMFFTVFTAGIFAQDRSQIIYPDAKTPVVLDTSPGGGDMNVDLSSSIHITFNMDMNEKSINGSTLLIYATYTDTMPGNYDEVMIDDQIRDQSIFKHSKNSWQQTTGAVSGSISYSDRVAVFTPNDQLNAGSLYTFTVTSGVKSSEYVPLKNNQSWSFTTTGTSVSNNMKKQNNGY